MYTIFLEPYLEDFLKKEVHITEESLKNLRQGVYNVPEVWRFDDVSVFLGVVNQGEAHQRHIAVVTMSNLNLRIIGGESLYKELKPDYHFGECSGGYRLLLTRMQRHLCMHFVEKGSSLPLFQLLHHTRSL
jgi:hypothetical protein